MDKSNIEQRESGLYEKSSGRKIESPLDTKCQFCSSHATKIYNVIFSENRPLPTVRFNKRYLSIFACDNHFLSCEEDIIGEEV